MIQVKSAAHLYQAIWLFLLVSGIIYISTNLRLVSDLSQFIPAKQSSDANSQNFNLLLDEIEKGDAATLLLMEISAPIAEESASLSRLFRKQLQQSKEFSSVNNGSFAGVSEEIQNLFNYRFLFREGKYDTDSLRYDLNKRLEELQLGMGMVLKNTLQHDPQNSFINYLTKFQQRGTPTRYLGVWFDKDKKNALLIARMKPGGFSMDKQAASLDLIQNQWLKIPGSGRAKLRISGPATFAVATKNEIQKTTNRLAIVAGLFMLLIFRAGYRSFRLFLIAGLPLASAIIGGLCITNIIFGNIHGITVAFGITILGVCLDYPVHLFSHLSRDASAKASLNSIWPTLRLGVVTTVLGYLAMLNTGFTGLSQLAIFSSSGLVIALLVTRWIVAGALPDKLKIMPVLSWIPEFKRQRCSTYCRTVLVVTMLVISVYVFQFSHKDSVWQQDIAALSPIPKEARKFDQYLRDSLGMPDVGYLFLIRDKDPEMVLQKTETIKAELMDLKVRGIAKNIFSVTDQLPSLKRQEQIQKKLPVGTDLRKALHLALQGMPFKKELFEPFITDVERSRTLTPLSISEMKAHELTAALTQDMFMREGQWVSIIRMAGVKDKDALQAWLTHRPHLKQYFMDIRNTSSSLVNDYRDVAIQRFILGVLLILSALVIFLQSIKKALLIFFPVMLALLFSITTQVMFGVSLSIFHVLALLLVAGIGLDYSLFFQRPWTSATEQKKHFHGIIISAASTIMAFAMLGLSGVPVMAAMGITVTLGIMASFVFGWLWVTAAPKQGKIGE